MQKKWIVVLILFWGILPAAWADEPINACQNDPYETYNRHAYKMNQKLNQVIFRPVACLYKNVTPNPIRKGVNNFLSNLSQIPAVINDLLQANFTQAGRDVVRFGVNTTIGLGGFLDIAAQMGFDRYPQDFGLTLAKWGYQSSNYLVLPILGPSTIRDAVAWPIYYQMTVYPYIPDQNVAYSLLGLDFIDLHTQLLDLDPVIEQSFDPYVFERDAYLQRRNYLMHRNPGAINQTMDSTADSEVSAKEIKGNTKESTDVQ